MKKRFLCKMLAGMIAFSLATPICGIAVNAEENVAVDVSDEYAGDYDFRLQNDGTFILYSYSGNDENWVVPSEYLGEPVTAVNYGALQDNENDIKKVIIPAGITKIEFGAFMDKYTIKEFVVDSANTSYKAVDGVLYSYNEKTLVCYPAAKEGAEYTVLDTVTNIGGAVFDGAKNLEIITFPENYTKNYIYAYTFRNCTSLKQIVLPKVTTRILREAFANCSSLKSINIPANVKEIGDNAFWGCTALEDVYYYGTESEWNKIDFYTGNEPLTGANIHFVADIKDFVARMYTTALGRDYDEKGLFNWIQLLAKGTYDGAAIAKEFVLGQEFALRNLTDEQYVDILYATFFNREADASGKELWLATLANGATREYVLSQFVNLDEFALLCEQYGINQGFMFENGMVATPGAIMFVNRLYENVLGRAADNEGLAVWTLSLMSGTVTAAEATVNFFESEEYKMKATDNATYVNDVYKVFMGREADAEGLAFWVACLEEQGVSREWVIAEFAKSAEFKEIAAKYGL